MTSPDLAAKCEAAWDDILTRITEGEIVSKACAAHGLSRGALAHWRRADPARTKAYLDARIASAMNLEEQAIETASNPDIDPQRARVMVDTFKWAAAKRDPDRYADRSRHDINVKSLDLTPILERAEARLQLAQAAGRVLEGVVLERVEHAREDDNSLL